MRRTPPITVIPGGGLCNRMAMLDSALALGRALDRPVYLHWVLRPELNARFEDLFEPLPALAGVRHVWAHGRWGHLKLRWGTGLARVMGTEFWCHRRLEGLWADREGLLERARSARALRIRGDARFFEEGAPYQGFAPHRRLAARVAALEPALRDAVGVHVRRTDNADATRLSPLEGFVEAMRAEQAARPGTRFFVSTDAPEVRTALARTFGAALFHHPHEGFDRNDPKAIADAVVDLWSLACCRSLIGSAASTFSIAAHQLRGIPHRIVYAPAPGQATDAPRARG